MAYYDREAAMRRKECADKYAELKKHITSKDESGKLNEWFLAHEHIECIAERISTSLIEIIKKQMETVSFAQSKN